MKLAVNQATLMKTPMEPFLKAISQAGFEGVELRRDETFAYLKDHSVQDLKKLLNQYNLKCITFNAIELFSLCPEDEFWLIYNYTEELMKIGFEINCNTIIAVPSFLDSNLSEEKIISQTAERLEHILNLAEMYGFRVGFEPLGFPNCSVSKIDLALRVIERAESLKSTFKMGLVIDTFHYFLGEHKLDDLDQIPLDKLWLIHINDSVKKPIQQLKDGDRVLPSQGFLDLKGFINKLNEKGYDGWLSLELFNEKIWDEDPLKVAEDSMKSITNIL